MRNHAHALFLAPALLLLPSRALAQVPTAYDYTSIKPPNYKVPHFLEGDRDTIAAAHITLIDLIRIEYDYSPEHIIGLTPQQRNTRFDVVSKIDPPGVPDPEHNPHAYDFMIDALLKNHFRLVVHEDGEPFEQLMSIGNGKKLSQCPPPSAASTTDNSTPTPTNCITMDELAARLANVLRVRVVNKTDLPGAFAVGPNWPGSLVSSTPRGALSRIHQILQGALHADLGLMIVPGQPSQNKVLVVDHVEFPVILEETRTATNN